VVEKRKSSKVSLDEIENQKSGPCFFLVAHHKTSTLNGQFAVSQKYINNIYISADY